MFPVCRIVHLTLRRLVGVTAAVVLLLGAFRPVLADGVIIPDPPPGPEPPPLHDSWLTIRYHRVDVTIEDQVAVTRVEQEFVNEHNREAEGTYVFPLPEGASISEFTMWVDGEPVEGRILEADEARRIYEDIVRRRRDPALLEYVGRDAVKARIYPIPPGGSRKIELEYTQVLPVENGMVRYTYPLSTEKFSARPLEECAISVDVRSNDAMHAIYSPTHQDRAYIERDGDYHATIGYEENDVLPEQDFELIYTVSQEDVGLDLLTYREPPEDGFFTLLVAPTVEVGKERVIPRDVVLVLDTSGSMEGVKMKQAKRALSYVLEHLNEEDRFNVISFSTGLKRYSNDLRPTSDVPEAVKWVQSLEAIGGTNINRALMEALSSIEGQGGERPAVLIFLTDGLPTEGVTQIDQILASVESTAPENVRFFPFGVGDDVNTVLLDALAEQNRGATGYVRPEERIDEEVSALYAKIKTPVLTDIELDFGDVIVEETFPASLPDLFAGTQLILTGRYRLPSSHSEGARIKLTGRVNGERREFIYEGTFRASGGSGGPKGNTTSFIPRLWATRKIGHLLTQIRLHGEKEEWVDAVVDLSVRYGIITPYTSFLIEEEDILTEGGRQEAAEEYMAMPTAAPSGAQAVEKAEAEAGMREAESAAPSSGSGGVRTGETKRTVRHVGSKTFVLRDGIWTDTVFDPETMSTEKLDFGSQDYFELLASHPEWGDYLALDERVIFVADGAAYEVAAGEGEAASVPSTDTPEPAQPATAVPTRPPFEPSPTPYAPSSGMCFGAMAIGLGALIAVALWHWLGG